MTSRLTNKDKKDWKKFISSKEKVPDKDFKTIKSNNKKNKKIDLHGFSLEKANQIVEKFINQYYQDGVSKIIIITGKGTRSKTKENPYLSENLSILKYSVPEYIKSNLNLMNKIKKIDEAKIEDGGSGAFYVYLKNLKNKFR